MSRKPGSSEPASEENKQFDPSGKEGSHRFEKRMYWYSFLFLGELWAWMPGLFLVFAYLSVVYCFYQMIIFLRAEENMGEEKKINGDANQVDEERNRRASIFLPINPLKINTSRFDYIAMRWGYDISPVYPVWLLSLSRN